jgi:hypothetical protein
VAKVVSDDDVLQELVNQFADPMAFLRELIQNSIDAGSGEVDVRLEWAAQADGAGLMTISVQDFGEGMTRQIVETKLVRLFASTKDQDLTKIGRFGIGFVSVFALKPEAVCVDTGRTGESWRVLFKADRTYELIALREPVEGTLVRQFKRCAQDEHDDLVERGREVLKKWCRHVSIPVIYQGEAINEGFELGGALVARFEEPGTRVVAALVDEAREAVAGYFNRGLTLKDGAPSELPHVAYLIDSRYLEHTLTRDQVLRDDHYHKAMAIVERLVDRELYGALPRRIEAAAAAAQWPLYERLVMILVAVVRAGRLKWSALERAPLLRVVEGEGSRLATLAELRKALKAKGGGPLLGGADSALSRSLAAGGRLVICSAGADAAAQDAAGVVLKMTTDAHGLLEAAPRPGTGPLIAALVALGRELGGSRELTAQVVRWERGEGAGEAPLVVAAGVLGEACGRKVLEGPLAITSGRVLGIVEDAPGASEVFALAAGGRATLAALFAMRMALLRHGMTQEQDEALSRAAYGLMAAEVRDVR